LPCVARRTKSPAACPDALLPLGRAVALPL
jgi:hypothetical protein